MERTMYGFNYDFVRHLGTCLVISGAQPVLHGDLERIEKRMLESNEIPGLLPLEVEEIDLHIRLRYNITGWKMLSQWMKTERLTLPAYYRLLLQCARIIDDSKTYMLRQDGYWLHEDFLFVNPDSADEISMVYVPVSRSADTPDAKPPVREQFRELALRLSGCIDTIEGSEFSALMSVLRRERFEFHELRKQLSSYTEPGHKAQAHEQPTPSHNPYTVPEQSRVPPDRSMHSWSKDQQNKGAESAAVQQNMPSWIGIGTDSTKKENGSSYSSPSWSGEEENHDEYVKSDPAEQFTGRPVSKPTSSRQRLLAAASAGAILLLLWSFYPAEAPEGALIVWAGLTVLLLDAVFVFALLRPGWPGKEKLQAIAQSYHAMEEREMTGLTGYLPPRPKGGRQPAQGKYSYADPLPDFSAPSESEQSLSQAGLFKLQEAAVGSSEATTLLSTPDATVLLRPEAYRLAEEEEAEQPHYSELEVHKAGHVERIALKTERFLIGRDQGAVDYTEDEAGVSKQHAEIVCERSSYYVKDLASKNGTLWNNEPMVPYKWYPLAEGDAVQIVHTRFVFVGKQAKTANHSTGLK